MIMVWPLAAADRGQPEPGRCWPAGCRRTAGAASGYPKQPQNRRVQPFSEAEDQYTGDHRSGRRQHDVGQRAGALPSEGLEVCGWSTAPRRPPATTRPAEVGVSTPMAAPRDHLVPFASTHQVGKPLHRAVSVFQRHLSGRAVPRTAAIHGMCHRRRSSDRRSADPDRRGRETAVHRLRQVHRRPLQGRRHSAGGSTAATCGHR